jgi:hypothetical protein
VNRCLVCGKPVKKKFCSLKHKDRWHNINNPRGHFAHLARHPFADVGEKKDPIEDAVHPFDPDAFGKDQE